MRTVRRIYHEYGGIVAFLKSPYLWFSAALVASVLVFGSVREGWLELPTRVLPPLIGFTVASFSLVFAVTSEDTRLILSQPSERLNNRRPLLVIITKIVHAVFVQLVCLIATSLMVLKPFYTPAFASSYTDVFNGIFGGITGFLFVYGVALVFSVATAFYTLVESIVESLDTS